jgi:hypothetical protein
MVRLAVLGVLLAFSVWEWLKGPNKPLYVIALFGLFVFFSLRYGQGTDYLNYLSIYSTVGPLQSLPNYFDYNYNKVEIGYFYLVSFFKMFGMHFSVFIAIVTGGSLLLIDRFVRRFSPLPIFSLAVFYAVYSITYMESGLRQLIALCVVVGWAMPDWLQGRRVSAVIGILLASTIHSSALVMLILIIFFRKDNSLSKNAWPFTWTRKQLSTAAIITALVGAVLATVNFTSVIALLPERCFWRRLRQAS